MLNSQAPLRLTPPVISDGDYIQRIFFVFFFGPSHAASGGASIPSQSLSACFTLSISLWCSGQQGSPGLPQSRSSEVRDASSTQTQAISLSSKMATSQRTFLS